MIAVLFYNLSTALIIKRLVDLQYSIYILIQIVFWGFFTGLIGLFFLPESPIEANKLLVISMSLSIAFGVYFFSRVLEVDRSSVSVRIGLISIYTVVLISPFSVYLGYFHFVLPWLLASIIASYILLGTYSLIAIKRDEIEMQAFGIGYLLYGASILITVTTNLGWAPATYATLHSGLAGQLLHALFMQIGLFIQIQRLQETGKKLVMENRELTDISEHDHVTRLFNRNKLDQILYSELQRCKRYERNFCVIMIDIDNFKMVNDIYGHQKGDTVLIAVANCINNNVRNVDIVGRWGGEEFMVICPETDL